MLLCMVFATQLWAAGTTDLAAYLAKGRAAGVNIIYASTVVTPSQTLSVSGDAAFSLETLRQYLPDLGLVLEELSSNTYLLRRGVEPVPAPPVAAEDPVIEAIVGHSSV